MVKVGFVRIFSLPGSRLRDKKYRNQLSVFFVCLSVASLVWLVIKLSKEYSLTINWPVSYQNVPAGKVLALKSDTTLLFQIKGKGFDLLHTYFNGPSQRVTVDLSKLRFLRDKGKIRNAYLPTYDIKAILASQLKLDEGLISIKPDTLFFQLTAMRSKRIPVLVPVDYTTVPSFGLYGRIEIKPDTIRVEGPAAIIDTIRFATARSIKLDALDATTIIKTSLSAGYNKLPLTFNQRTFDVTIPIEKYTEATVTVPLVPANDSCRMRFFPEKISLICQVAMRDYKRLEPSLFRLSVDCKAALNSNSRFISPLLIISPDYIKVIRMEPAQVEYIILQ
ncbi:MAG TPA: hypothetical protein DEO70_06380 [Bacteroidales bacterium]|nr:MAG: hypothetical protein A2X11_08425 [Bacteroidetes bacterium GWE2_42_24]OFY30947.1 MAG: hypothetical protein A2X09_17200 [Bacteroidetes bacterium GWF2_43_11]HBZ66447.1 hypothetical protein [Bacteroidales bacterium]